MRSKVRTPYSSRHTRVRELHSEGRFQERRRRSTPESGASVPPGALAAAARFLGEKLGPPELLIGHSLGGSAVLAAARRIPESKAIVTIGAPSDPGHLRPILAGAAPAIETEGEAEVVLAGRKFRIKRQLLEDLREHNLLHTVGKLEKPLLVLHSPADEVVGINHAHRIFDAAKHPKSFVAIQGADHLLRDHTASDYVASVISAWAAWYIGRIK